MSTTTTMTAPVAENTPTDPARPPKSRPLPSQYQTIDGLIKSHAAEPSTYTLVAYPVSGLNDFEGYDARDLDRFIDATVATYISHGIAPADPSLPEAPVMALLAPSSLDYYLTFFALNRLGYAVLFLSTRLATEAYVELMKMSDCRQIIASASFQSMIGDIQQSWSSESFPLITRADYRHVQNPPRFVREGADPATEGKKIAWIIHSSGSTGFPKSIPMTNMQCLANFYKGLGLKAFCVSPLFHSQALSECGRALYAKKPMYLGNFAFPVTTQNLIEAMSVARPEMFNVVPYVLKLMAESPQGIAQLQKTKLVKYAGSACPDALGDKLVAAGVNLVANYGATETGFIMDSFRPPGDDEWAYMRLQPSIGKHVLMDEITPGVFECVGLDGLPSKGPSNSDDPPNSFRTRDLFTRHPDPAKSNYYKYLSRLDDRLTLVNSEKVLPLPIEGRIRQDPLVAEAAVFGAGRSVPGVIIFRNANSSHLSDSEFLSAIQPSVDAANAAAESFSRVPQELIIPMAADTTYPKTDKGTFIRAQLYQVFATQIEAAYNAFEATAPADSNTLQELSVAELEAFLMDAFANTLNIPLPSTTADIFSCGVDSLQTTRLYGLIRKHVALGANAAKLSSNVVFEKGTVAALAQHLYSLRTGEIEEENDDVALMQKLIEQYSVFTPHDPANHPAPDQQNQTVLVTGCTGSLGAYIAASLLRRPTVAKVYALVRAPNDAAAQSRVHAQLTSRGVTLTPTEASKLISLPSDLTLPTLGLSPTHLETLRTTLTHTIHAAWPVNFNLPLAAFGPSLHGIQNLINLCRTVHLSRPASFYFCSSVSSASGTPRPATIAERPIPLLAHAQRMGYGKAKLCGERITNAAASASAPSSAPTPLASPSPSTQQQQQQQQSRVLRIGQLSGDLSLGRWNATEAIALLIRCAAQPGLRCLPRLDERVSWLPVDVCGESVVSLSLRETNASSQAHTQAQTDTQTQTDTQAQEEEEELVYHVLNPTTLHWTYDVLPALRRTGLLPPDYEEVAPREWLARLRERAETFQDAAEVNPCVKLLGFWEGKYGNAVAAAPEKDSEANCGGSEEDDEGAVPRSGLRFETEKTRRDAPVVGSAGREVLLQEGEQGYMSKLVQSWLEAWGMQAS